MFVPNSCRNDELNLTMSWVGCLLFNGFKLFILFAENSQNLLKISFILIFLTFMYLEALNLLVNNQHDTLLNSTHHCTAAEIRHNSYFVWIERNEKKVTKILLNSCQCESFKILTSIFFKNQANNCALRQ